MKKIILFFSVVASILTYGQESKDGNRICDSKFSDFGLEGKTFLEAIDYAGKVHNDYQEYFFNELSILKPDFKDTMLLKQIISSKSKEFFTIRGLNYDEKLYTLGLAQPVTLDMTVAEDISNEAQTLASEFINVLKGYSEATEVSFFNNLASLKASALRLEKELEVFRIGVPISIAIYSYEYWKVNGQKWMDMFANNITEDNTTISGKGPSKNDLETDFKKKCNVNLWHIGGADAAGAYGGAMAGAALGPGGALAGGVLTSSVSSLGNLTNQVINCFVSWWPF